MQKIKYPVGSKLRIRDSEIFIITDILPSELICCLVGSESGECAVYTQKDLDRYGYTLISSPPWKPEIGEEYWYLDARGDEFKANYYKETVDEFRRKSGNMFRTEEEAVKYRDEILSRE